MSDIFKETNKTLKQNKRNNKKKTLTIITFCLFSVGSGMS